ncbi:hypothetical protein [Desulfobulbus sp.]|uniref:hypothetical protein n=1 Tax=Desulfobulbus sp. TaxID=895 RepID=UPI0027BA4D31|nr:hypothetical protein [Desulfobulbus sp.]
MNQIGWLEKSISVVEKLLSLYWWLPKLILQSTGTKLADLQKQLQIEKEVYRRIHA